MAPTRIEVNVMTGEIKEIELTQQEIDAIAAQAASAETQPAQQT